MRLTYNGGSSSDIHILPKQASFTNRPASMSGQKNFDFVNYTSSSIAKTGRVPSRPTACKACRAAKAKVGMLFLKYGGCSHIFDSAIVIVKAIHAGVAWRRRSRARELRCVISILPLIDSTEGNLRPDPYARLTYTWRDAISPRKNSLV